MINDYLIVAIKSFIYIYHIDDDNNFQYYTSILFDIGGSIQSICPFDNNIIGIGSKSGIVLFFEKNELLKRTFVKNKERNNVELKDLVKLDEENIICLKNIDGKQIINLINKENMKLEPKEDLLKLFNFFKGDEEEEEDEDEIEIIE